MTSNAPGANQILGILQSADGKGNVRMEDRFDTDIGDLWSAVTEPQRLARWLGEVEGDLRLGSEFRAHFFASGREGTGNQVHVEHLAAYLAGSELCDAEARWQELAPAYQSLVVDVS